MQIDTIFDVNDVVYCIHEDSIMHGTVVQISISIDSYGVEIKRFVITDNSSGRDEYCDKFHHEIHRSIEDLIASIKKQAKKITKKKGPKNVN